MRRRVIAIGDLHGDVYRLERILERQSILKDGHWKSTAGHYDVVLLGDYVDWRGENLEGPRQSWERGVANLMDLLMTLASEVANFRRTSPNFKSAFHPLMGNHDKLMLDSWRYLKSLPPAKLKPLEALYSDPKKVQQALPAPRPKTPESVLHQRLVNWLSVGGPASIKSFGGLDAWLTRMDAGLGQFLQEGVRLGVVINGWQYTHSIPDDPKYWRPLGELESMPPPEREQAVEEMVWGRKIWGLDYKTGGKVAKPDQAWVDKMLAGFKVSGVVVGHSLVQSLYPVKAYDGKVVNIDMHGNPLSEPWLEDYDDAEVVRPFR